MAGEEAEKGDSVVLLIERDVVLVSWLCILLCMCVYPSMVRCVRVPPPAGSGSGVVLKWRQNGPPGDHQVVPPSESLNNKNPSVQENCKQFTIP